MILSKKGTCPTCALLTYTAREKRAESARRDEKVISYFPMDTSFDSSSLSSSAASSPEKDRVIVAEDWLNEIQLPQYSETFITNISADEKTLPKKRLQQIRQKDLSSMNITNFQHQKAIIAHISSTVSS